VSRAELDAARTRITALEAEVKGHQATMSSICKADDGTFAAYQRRITALEADQQLSIQACKNLTDALVRAEREVAALRTERQAMLRAIAVRGARETVKQGAAVAAPKPFPIPRRQHAPGGLFLPGDCER
jgi:septal ring factor EnvC (AmiA/AmiB activator)